MPRAVHDEYLRRFGVGEPSGLGLPGDGVGIMPDVRYESTRHTAAFGQGVSMSAVTLASVYATIANGGVRVTPSIVAGTIGPDGRLSPAPTPTARRVVSADTARQVSEMLEMVVTDGTGKPGAVPGYRVAGKTGTAQRFDSACRCYRGFTASFAGFAPADDPAIVVAVSLQNPVHGHYGGLLAGPVFNEIVSYGLQALEVPPTGTKPPALPLRESDEPVNVD
jgi:cell division protein FtsI (penicillin-binding protein 3)